MQLRPTRFFGGAAFVLVTAASGCKVEQPLSDVKAGEAPALVAASELEVYKKALPKIAAPKVAAILANPKTLFYDDKAMPKTYQDTVGDISYTPVGMRLNSDGAGLIVPEGKNMFTEDGKTWSFPFAVTAGTDASTNVKVINFLHLPEDAAGAKVPIAYRVESDQNGTGGLGLHRWSWAYPVGAMLGEMIYIAGDGNTLLPVELRTRERQAGGWSTNVFRPFPTAAALAAALKAKNSTAASQLEGPAALKPISRSTEGFGHIMKFEGFTEQLPDIEPAIVKDLLTTTTFVSSYGASWRKSDNQIAYAPTTTSAMSIVPNNYEAGALEITDESCVRCHKETSRMLKDIERERTGQEQTVLYGDLWGSDHIFSFHIFDITKYNGASTENRALRPEFAQSGLVVPYDGAKHTISQYPASANWPGATQGEAPAINPPTNPPAKPPTPASPPAKPPTPAPPPPSPPNPPTPPRPPQTPPAQPDPTVADGRAIFAQTCAKCHPTPESDARLRGKTSIPEKMRQYAPVDARGISAIEMFLRSL